MIHQLAALLVLAAAATAYPYALPYYGGYAAPYAAAYHAPLAPAVGYHAPVYHAPVATSYHNTYRYPSYKAYPYYPGYAAAAYHAPLAPVAAAYHAPIVPGYARYYRSAEQQQQPAEAEQKQN